MRMIRRTDDHGVDLAMKLVEHLAEVVIGPGPRASPGSLPQVILVHVTKCNDVLPGDGLVVVRAAAPDPHQGDVECLSEIPATKQGRHRKSRQGRPRERSREAATRRSRCGPSGRRGESFTHGKAPDESLQPSEGRRSDLADSHSPAWRSRTLTARGECQVTHWRGKSRRAMQWQRADRSRISSVPLPSYFGFMTRTAVHAGWLSPETSLWHSEDRISRAAHT